jgi:hypothetical protein
MKKEGEKMKKIGLLLVLSATLSCLIAFSVQASEKSIEPDTVWLTLSPGQSASIAKTVIVPTTIPKGDIVFSFDLTGSMGDELAVAQAQAVAIMDSISGLVTDVQFGVISYMDYPHSYNYCGYPATYGDSSSPCYDYAYKLDQPLISNTTQVANVINGLSIGCGNDGPQDYERIFYESYADPSIGYRPGAKRILINIGDCIPHDCNLSEGIEPGVFTTGGDPGRDEIMGNSDDLDLQTVLAGMAANGVTLLEVHGSSNCGYLNYWEYWCSLTGGAFFLLNNASQIPAAVESLIQEQALHIDSLYLKEMTPGYEAWLTSVIPSYYLDITAPDTVHFIETITVPKDTTCGTTHVFQISAIGDGASYGDEIVIVDVVCGTVIIPNDVYERFNFGHWDYFCWQEPELACDNRIELDDACEPYRGINPGDYFEIPIILENFTPEISIGGFELEVEFDYIDLTFYGAERGGLLERREQAGDMFYSWEYFTYRMLPCPLCACCKNKILLYGQADMPDGLLRKGYCLGNPPDWPNSWWYVDTAIVHHKVGPVTYEPIGATLAWLKFQVANNELLRDLKLPIVFEWEHKLSNDLDENGRYYIIQDWDCAENTFSSCDGAKLYVSRDPYQYNPDVCPSDVATLIEFKDGGVHICSPCTAFTCVRGDINLDEVVNSVADAVMLARYLVYGIDAFVIDRNVQLCASDVNADGRPGMLADLVYLIRVILHDATAFPKLTPSSDIASVIVSNNVITTECASPIGAILFEFNGAVNPTLLATNMEMLSNGNKVLVWSRNGSSIEATSEVINIVPPKAGLVRVTAVDRDSRELKTSFVGKVAPTTFALHPAYPNPFNPYTNLSFTLPEATGYSLKIYNVAGQLVRSYEAMGQVGLNVVTWDGKDNAGVDVASGIYFYKLSAGSFSATAKMIMMK